MGNIMPKKASGTWYDVSFTCQHGSTLRRLVWVSDLPASPPVGNPKPPSLPKGRTPVVVDVATRAAGTANDPILLS